MSINKSNMELENLFITRIVDDIFKYKFTDISQLYKHYFSLKKYRLAIYCRQKKTFLKYLFEKW